LRPTIDHRADVRGFHPGQSEIVPRRKAHHTANSRFSFGNQQIFSLMEINSRSGSSAGKSLSKQTCFCRTDFPAPSTAYCRGTCNTPGRNLRWQRRYYSPSGLATGVVCGAAKPESTRA
jgi:hypothetical protein